MALNSIGKQIFLLYLSLLFMGFAQAQDSTKYKDKNLVFGATLGLNNPYAKAYKGQITSTLLDPNGNIVSQTLQATTSNTLLPPLQVYTDWSLAKKWNLGVSAIFALHKQTYTITDLQTNTIISSSSEALASFYVMANAKYLWHNVPELQLGSGLGAGYTYGQPGQKTPVPENHLALAIQPIFLRYLICCGWHLQTDLSFYNSPAGTNPVAFRGGYNLGLGVVYVFQKPEKGDLP